MMACAALACALAQVGEADPVALSCSGRAFTYTPDLSRQVQVLEPFDFEVVLDLALGRLASAPVAEPHSFRLRDAGDAVFFFRDRLIAGRSAVEWISINRISGNYAHFIALRDTI